jgi:tetratricopeptide (TPR) repeat protein
VSSTPLPSDIASASRAASDSISRTKEESFEGFAAAGRGSRVLAFLSDPKRAWPAYAAAGVTLVLVLVLAVDLQSAARPSSSFAVAESRTPPHVAGPRPFGARVEAETDDAVAATTIETGPDEAAESPDQAGSPDELEDLALEDPFAAALPEPAARDLEAFVHWREEGRRLFSEGRYPDAMEAYARATELNPAHAGSFAGLAASALEAGEIERGVVAYQEAVRLAPTQSGYHAALGRAYRDAGRIDLAVESYRQALRLNRRNSAARAALRELGFRVRPRRR